MTTYLGEGIYAVSEAARLSGVSAGRIRRWLRGYTFEGRSGPVRSPPVWLGAFEPVEGALALSFHDLMEIRFVDAFLQEGVSWKVMRKARERASKLVRSDHPFCTRKFFTDGRRILADLQEGDSERALVDVIHRQQYFEQIVRPFARQLEFADSDLLLRWWPQGVGRQIVVDPARSFGRPIVSREGIPTSVLAAAIRAGNSPRDVCRWYEVSSQSVRGAMRFEESLAA